MRIKLFILLPVILLFFTTVESQSNANLEAGFSVGLASFQTDFGERGDFKSGVTGNVGLALGGVVYLNFFNRDPVVSAPVSWGQQHFKLKGEVSYLQAKLEHFGRYVEEVDSTGAFTLDARRLKRMTGKTSVLNFGAILEYHPFPIPDFVPGSNRNVSPYFGLGVMGGLSKPTIEVAQGDWETNPSILIEAYRPEGAIDETSKIVLSLMFSGGLRFKMSDSSSILADMRWQYFSSDHVDGLEPDNDVLGGENKHNDWLYYLNVGYIYKFGPGNKVSTWFKRR